MRVVWVRVKVGGCAVGECWPLPLVVVAGAADNLFGDANFQVVGPYTDAKAKLGRRGRSGARTPDIETTRHITMKQNYVLEVIHRGIRNTRHLEQWMSRREWLGSISN